MIIQADNKSNDEAENDVDISSLGLSPNDEYNRMLVSQTHPLDWVNPQPKSRYHLVVIGAGTAGLVTASIAAGLGAKVALIEKHLMGGDCLNVGCVPSKAILRAARAVHQVRSAAKFGVHASEISVDFPAVMERLRKLRSEISHHDSASRFQSLGIDVFIGAGKFRDTNTIEVAGATLKFRKAVIATGARAAMPPIEGLAETEYLNNENLFNLTELPKRIAVIGAGPIGCEISQAFARFGSQVTLFESTGQILSREDADAAAVLEDAFVQGGVNVIKNSRVTKVEPHASTSEKIVSYQKQGEQLSIIIDEIVVAVGRAPNLEGLNLDAVGVEYDTKTGVKVDDRLRTTNRSIYAAGDICSPFKFTHAADFQARIVVRNALFKGRGKSSKLVIPWATYTSPELAHVGLTASQAEKEGVEIETFTQAMSGVDRAILDGETEGFVKVHVQKGTDKIIGATIVAENAGDLISEITFAMTNRIGLSKLGSVIHPYPTQADAVRKIGDLYSRTKLTPFVKNLFQKWFAWTK